LIRKNDDLGHSKVAILTNPGRDLEVVRKFSRITVPRALVKIRGFDEETEALNWLRESNAVWLACFLAFVLYAARLQLDAQFFAL
jgi:hypothetical protein